MFVILYSLIVYKQCMLMLSRESVMVENVRLICLPDLTADFGDKTSTKLTPNCVSCIVRAKLVFRALSVHTVTLTPNFCVNFLTYNL